MPDSDEAAPVSLLAWKRKGRPSCSAMPAPGMCPRKPTPAGPSPTTPSTSPSWRPASAHACSTASHHRNGWGTSLKSPWRLCQTPARATDPNMLTMAGRSRTGSRGRRSDPRRASPAADPVGAPAPSGRTRIDNGHRTIPSIRVSTKSLEASVSPSCTRLFAVIIPGPIETHSALSTFITLVREPVISKTAAGVIGPGRTSELPL